MQYKLILFILTCTLPVCLMAQQGERKPLRIVDTLTPQEKAVRNPVILRSEFDSLVKLYVAAQPVSPPVVKETIREVVPSRVAWMISLPLVLIAALLYLLFRQQQRWSLRLADISKLLAQAKLAGASVKTAGNTAIPQTDYSQAELDKLKKDNEEMHRLLGNYEAVKQQISASYKIRNYPGYEASKSEEELLKGLLDTEKAIAVYSYEHFLKPVIAITDANKNNPARTSREDREKLVELLVSLSLLYIEYLYLRVNELSVGGNMVARIQGLSNGHRVDTMLMKPLSTEHGSRALVVRMALDKMNIRGLTYPVFDETNLNLS